MRLVINLLAHPSLGARDKEVPVPGVVVLRPVLGVRHGLAVHPIRADRDLRVEEQRRVRRDPPVLARPPVRALVLEAPHVLRVVAQWAAGVRAHRRGRPPSEPLCRNPLGEAVQLAPQVLLVVAVGEAHEAKAVVREGGDGVVGVGLKAEVGRKDGRRGDQEGNPGVLRYGFVLVVRDVVVVSEKGALGAVPAGLPNVGEAGVVVGGKVIHFDVPDAVLRAAFYEH